MEVMVKAMHCIFLHKNKRRTWWTCCGVYEIWKKRVSCVVRRTRFCMMKMECMCLRCEGYVYFWRLVREVYVNMGNDENFSAKFLLIFVVLWIWNERYVGEELFWSLVGVVKMKKKLEMWFKRGDFKMMEGCNTPNLLFKSFI